jgi:hypothetical protein
MSNDTLAINNNTKSKTALENEKRPRAEKLQEKHIPKFQSTKGH